jgi:cytochrome c oxidase subunit 3/cytochrome o ubiquinol oxidase subunit 3
VEQELEAYGQGLNERPRLVALNKVELLLEEELEERLAAAAAHCGVPVLAVSAANQKDDRGTTLWLTITALLGATFVGGQVYEFTAFYNEGLGFTTSLFASSFYVLTGFHGVHVTVGIIMLMSLVGILKRSKVPGSKSETVEMIGLYWHFVDVVWIVIFTLIYLIPV